MSSHQRRGSVEFGNPNPTGRRGSAVRFSTKGDRRVSMASLAGSAGGGGGGGHRDMDGAVRKKGKRAAWMQAVTGGGGDEHGSMSQTEVHVEVEPRGFSSAVSRSGRMIAKECYRCLTTVCQKWHSFGKLELRLCNGCRVLMDKKVCGYCGKEESDDLLDRNLYNCVMCLRCTHQKCEEKWRSAGHNEYKLCIVCEMGARIRDRDFKSRSLKLLEGDLPSLLNHHIFFFSRYFEGKGPKTGFLFRPRDPIVSGQLFTSGEFAHTVKEDKKKREANKGSDADASSFVSNHMATFDELLALTDKPDVHVKESSEISNIVQKFSTLNFSSVTSKEPANMTSAEIIRRRRSTLGQSDGSPSLNSSSDPKSTLLKSRNTLESLSADLRELGYSYLTRTFPVDITPEQIAAPNLADYKGVYRRLDPNEVLFLFALDIGLCPTYLSKSTVRKVIFQTLGEGPKFGSMCSYIQDETNSRTIEASNVDRWGAKSPGTPGMYSMGGRGGHAFVSVRSNYQSNLKSSASYEEKEHNFNSIESLKNVKIEQLFVSFLRRAVDTRFNRGSKYTAREEKSAPPRTRAEIVSMEQANRLKESRISQTIKDCRLDDPEFIKHLLTKYPSEEQLEEYEQQQEAAKEQAIKDANIVKGKTVPYPLEEPPSYSERYLNWQSALIDCFNFFTCPPSFVEEEKSEDDRTSHYQVMINCFKSLDADGDNIVSRADAIKVLKSEQLADVLLASFQPTADPSGVSWIEFHSGGTDPVGAAWEALLLEADTVDERIARGVMLLQRLTASPWLEPDGKEKGHHRQPVMEDTTCGSGVLFLTNRSWMPVVSQVVKPGPADDILFPGDIVVSVDGIELKGMLLGKAIGTLCGLWGQVETGSVKLGIMRRGPDVIYESVMRIPPPPRVQTPLRSLTARQQPTGTLTSTDVRKMFRMLGVMPDIIIADELSLMMDNFREGGDAANKDEQLALEWDDFFSLCRMIMLDDRFSSRIASKLADAPEDAYLLSRLDSLGYRSAASFDPVQVLIQSYRTPQPGRGLAEDDFEESHQSIMSSDSPNPTKSAKKKAPRFNETESAFGTPPSSSGGSDSEAGDGFGGRRRRPPMIEMPEGGSLKSMPRPMTNKSSLSSTNKSRPNKGADAEMAGLHNAMAQEIMQEEDMMGKLYSAMRLPRCDNWEGKKWVKGRLDAYLKSATGKDAAADPKLWSSPKALLRSDGVDRYTQACRQLGVPPVRSVLQQLLNLEPKLQLSNYNLGVHGATALAASLVDNLHITKLCINGCGLGAEGTRAICEALSENRHLSSVDLTDNHIGSRFAQEVEGPTASVGIIEISKLLQLPGSTITCLKLSSCGITDKDALHISQKGLKGNVSLTSLDLSRNEIGDKGAKALAKNIQFRDELQFVSLLWNRIGPDGLSKIRSAVRAKNMKKIERKSDVVAEPVVEQVSEQPKQERAFGNKYFAPYGRFNNGAGGRYFEEEDEEEAPLPPPRVNVPYNDNQIEGLAPTEAAKLLRDVLLNEPVEPVKAPNVTVLIDTLRRPKPTQTAQSSIFSPLKRHGSSFQGRMDASSIMHSKYDYKVIRSSEEKKPEPRIKDKFYLAIKTLLSNPGLSPEDRLALLKMKTSGYTLTVIQAWEQIKSFEPTELKFEAGTFLMSKLRGRVQQTKLQALREAAIIGERKLRVLEEQERLARSSEEEEDYLSLEENDSPTRGSKPKSSATSKASSPLLSNRRSPMMRSTVSGRGKSPLRTPGSQGGLQSGSFRSVSNRGPASSGQASPSPLMPPSLTPGSCDGGDQFASSPISPLNQEQGSPIPGVTHSRHPHRHSSSGSERGSSRGSSDLDSSRHLTRDDERHDEDEHEEEEEEEEGEHPSRKTHSPGNFGRGIRPGSTSTDGATTSEDEGILVLPGILKTSSGEMLNQVPSRPASRGGMQPGGLPRVASPSVQLSQGGASNSASFSSAWML